MPSVGRSSDAPVQNVSTARESLRADQARRTRNYLITMAIRTACFILLVVVDGPLRWVFAAGAVFLPMVAVVAANAVRPLASGRVEPVLPAVDPVKRLTQ